jgi:hypothetical protein
MVSNVLLNACGFTLYVTCSKLQLAHIIVTYRDRISGGSEFIERMVWKENGYLLSINNLGCKRLIIKVNCMFSLLVIFKSKNKYRRW